MRTAVLLATAARAAAAVAQEPPPASDPALTVTGAVALTSDYRWRGYSLSAGGPAIQASLDLSHRSGLFLGTWASSLAGSDGAAAEVDLYGGWSGPVGPFDTTVGLLAYVYPGATGLNYFEVTGTAAWTVGTLTLSGGFNWAPAQPNLDRSSRYLFGTAAFLIPNTPLTLTATLGSERGSVVPDNTGQTTAKLDWLVGLDLAGSAVKLDPLTLSLGYSSNNLPDRSGANADFAGGVFATLTATF
jgi:uncharacterized protein (TIGR02001 family)